MEIRGLHLTTKVTGREAVPVERRVMRPMRCSHGKTWSEPCLECEAVSLRGTIAGFEPLVTKAKERLKEVEREISEAAAVPAQL